MKSRKGQQNVIGLVATVVAIILVIVVGLLVISEFNEATEENSVFETPASNESVGTANASGVMTGTVLDNSPVQENSETVRCGASATTNYTLSINSRTGVGTLSVSGADCINDTVYADYTYFGGTEYTAIQETIDTGIDAMELFGVLVIAIVGGAIIGALVTAFVVVARG